MNEDRIRYLEMIQSTVSRMASNSFFLKGWTVTLVAGLFAISIADDRSRVYLIAYIPTFFFAILDMYYLWMERRYRRLFTEQASLSSPPSFSLDTAKFSKKSCGFLGCLGSISIWAFYIPLAAVIAIVGCNLK
jgi:hypothetical protein